MSFGTKSILLGLSLSKAQSSHGGVYRQASVFGLMLPFTFLQVKTTSHTPTQPHPKMGRQVRIPQAPCVQYVVYHTLS